LTGTPFLHAVFWGSSKCLRFIIKSGNFDLSEKIAIKDDYNNYNGSTAMEIADTNENREIVRLLRHAQKLTPGERVESVSSAQLDAFNSMKQLPLISNTTTQSKNLDSKKE